MSNAKLLAEIDVGDQIEGFYILKAAVIRTTASGKTYLSGTAADRSGTVDIKVWDYSGPISEADAGKVAKMRGEISEYRGTLQMTVSRIRLAGANDTYDVGQLVPVAPIDAEKRMSEIQEMIDSIEDPDYRKVAETLFCRHRDSLRNIPAAKSVHHSFLSGLLMHTSNMLRTADFLAGMYGNVIDRSLLLTGTLLHDLAKEKEFAFSELGLVTEYSLEGELLGHLVMGAQAAAEAAKESGMPGEKALLLQHMILSHHGEPEFGAAVRPLCAEAELLSYIDIMDSRMEIYEETLADVLPGEFSGRVFALDKHIYRHN